MRAEVLVVGGGPAGAAAATELARGGAQVIVVERERVAAHKVCGEFLSVEALGSLRGLGVSAEGLGAVPLRTVRFAGARGLREAALPFPAMSLTRRCLDAALLGGAEAAGAEVRRGSTVESVVRAGDGWEARLGDGEVIEAGAVFLASGKHDLRGYARPPGRQRGLVGFKMYWRLQPQERQRLGDAVELLLYPGGYAGLQPVEGDVVNLCALVRGETLRRLGGGWAGVLAHMLGESAHLRERLRGAEPELRKPLTVASLPYGFVREESDGIWYLGDQAVVIPSFTGDGMSLALHTGTVAAAMFLGGCSAGAYQRALARQTRRQVAVATAVSRALVGAPGLAVAAVRFWPGVLQAVARRTRIGAV